MKERFHFNPISKRLEFLKQLITEEQTPQNPSNPYKARIDHHRSPVENNFDLITSSGTSTSLHT